MTPHTLDEQKALLTAEAEGKVIFWIDAPGARRVSKVPGQWSFDRHRYEVERPLMEEWKVVDYFGLSWGTKASEGLAIEQAKLVVADNPERAPFRVVHLKEVR